MKYTSKVINTKRIFFIISFTFTFLIVNAIRVSQLMFMTDPLTGFYYESYEATGDILNIILIAAAVFITVFCLLIKQNDEVKAPIPNNFLGVAQIMLGVCLLIEPLFITDLPMSVPIFLKHIKTISIFASGIIFIVLGFLNFIGKKPNYLLIVVPTISYVVRLLVTFICYTGMSGIDSNIYEIVNLCISLAFLHFSSKILCDVYTNRTRNFTKVCAYLSILTTSMCSIPQMIFIIINHSGVHSAVDSIITNLFFMLYVVAFLVSKKQVETKKEHPEFEIFSINKE